MWKKVLLKILHDSQEIASAGAATTFIENETLAQAFSCKH